MTTRAPYTTTVIRREAPRRARQEGRALYRAGMEPRPEELRPVYRGLSARAQGWQEAQIDADAPTDRIERSHA